MTTLAIYSNKGGVGKTTTAVNLSYLAAQAGARTLLCDLDPQSSATYYFRVKPKLKFGAKRFIKGGEQIKKSIKGTDYENLDLLPADFTLRKLDTVFGKLKEWELSGSRSRFLHRVQWLQKHIKTCGQNSRQPLLRTRAIEPGFEKYLTPETGLSNSDEKK